MPHGPELSGADEPLAVERKPPPACQLTQRVGREVAAPERSCVDPARVGDRRAEPGLRVLRRPGQAEGLDPHLPAVTVVRQVEHRSRRLRPPDDREPDGVQRVEEGAIVLGAAGDDEARLAERPQRPGREQRHSAWPRRPAVDQVAGGVADDGDVTHAGEGTAPAPRSTTS